MQSYKTLKTISSVLSIFSWLVLTIGTLLAAAYLLSNGFLNQTLGVIYLVSTIASGLTLMMLAELILLAINVANDVKAIREKKA